MTQPLINGSEQIDFTGVPGLGVAGALVFISINQSIPNSVVTSITWDSEIYDTDNIHASNSSQLIVPAGISAIRLISQVHTEANAISYRESLSFTKNGAPVWAGNALNKIDIEPSMGEGSILSVTAPLFVSPGDAFTAYILQTAAGARNILGEVTGYRSWFAMELLQ